MEMKIRSRLRSPVVAIFALVLLAIVTGFAGVTATDYHQTIALSERLSQAMARLLEEHAKRTFDAADLVLDHFVEEGRLDMNRLTTPEQHEHARRLQARLPEQGSVWVHDTNGQAVLSSLGFPPPPVNVGDREYFRAHADGAQFVVGELVEGRYTRQRLFTISRRIDGPGGFLGIAVAPITAAYFQHFWNSLGLGPGSVLALFREDGAMIVRSAEGVVTGKRYTSSMIIAPHRDSDAGTFRGLSIIDGVDRILSYKKVRDLPVYAVAGIAISDALAPFWQRLWRNAALTAVVTAGAFVLGWLVFRSIGREEDATKRLAQALAEQRRAAVLLQAAKDEAEAAEAAAARANLAKSKFLAVASHDLRQPIQSLFLFSSVLRNQLGGHPATVTLDHMSMVLAGLKSLLDSVLDVARLEAGGVTPMPGPFPVGELLAQMDAEYSLRAAAKGLHLKVIGCNAVVVSDRKLLEQMVRNLVENALRYTQTGRILMGCRRRLGSIDVCVADTGCGIAAEDLKHIFEEFHQVGNGERGQAQGLGLGLSIVRHLSRLLEHPVSVASRLGSGSMFCIRIPRQAAVHNHETAAVR